MRANVATVLNGERIYTANVNEYIHSIVPSLPEQVPFCQADAVAKLKYSNLVSNPSVVRLMTKRKGKVYADKRAIIVQLRWAGLEPSSKIWNTRCLWFSRSQFGADPSIIRRFFALRAKIDRWPSSQLFSRCYLRVELKLDKAPPLFQRNKKITALWSTVYQQTAQN